MRYTAWTPAPWITRDHEAAGERTEKEARGEGVAVRAGGIDALVPVHAAVQEGDGGDVDQDLDQAGQEEDRP